MFGMTFLNSLFLWGLAAVSVPILIHFIKRNRAVKLPFAAMRFLKVDPAKKFKSQKLKQLLLLLMRIAAFAFLAFAFARPFFSNVETGSFWGDESRAFVVLVDNSFSMGYENNFQKAITKAKEIVRSARPGDQVTIMQFSETTKAIAETGDNFSGLSNFEDRFSLSKQSTNYLNAIQAAETVLLESQFESKTIHLISDFQKSARESLNPHWTIQSGINLNFVPIEISEFSNIAVVDVHISREHNSVQTGDVLTRIKNYGNDKKRVNVVLNINNKKIAQRNVAISADEEQIVQFKRVRFPKGNAFGNIELAFENESITIDNRHFFVLENKTKAQLLAVNGEPHKDATQDELFFLERAINLPDLAKYSLIKTSPKEARKYDFSNYRAVILVNVKNLDRETLQRLTYYVRAGGGLLLALGDNVNPMTFNRFFRDLTPASLTELAFKSVNRETSAILAEIDFQHSIFRLFAGPGQSDPSSAQFYQYFKAEPLTPESALAFFDDGNPAILERKVGAGKVILFTSSLDTEWNNLPVKAIFLPLIYQILDYLASERKGQKSLLVGDSVPLRNAQLNPLNDLDCTVKYPSGKKVEPEGDIFDDTSEPGIYEIRKNGKTSYVAVNVDPRESDLTPIPPDELHDLVAGVSETNIRSASFSSAKPDEQQEKNQKIWRFVILGVILLLIGETWLANRTYR